MVGRGFSCGTVADGFRNNQHLRLWVPAFAGTTLMIALSLSTQLSSSGLTGRSSTPRPLDYSQASLEYWVARSSRAMTSESVARFLRRHCEERLSAEAHRAKAEATKQSIEPQRKLDCFVARAPRNDDDTCLRDLAARFARVVHETFRPEIQRAQGMPGARCTRSLACEMKQSTRA